MTPQGKHWKLSEETKHRQRLSRLNDNNPRWKGNDVGLHALHRWIVARLPKPDLCQICDKKPPYDLANISGKYLRDLNDWQYLCRSCHMLSDGRLNNLRHYSDFHGNTHLSM